MAQRVSATDSQVQVDTLTAGSGDGVGKEDSQVQVDTLPADTAMTADSFRRELRTATANAAGQLDELASAMDAPPGDPTRRRLSNAMATCQMSTDLIRHLGLILTARCGVPESDAVIVLSAGLLARHDELLTKYRARQRQGSGDWTPPR